VNPKRQGWRDRVPQVHRWHRQSSGATGIGHSNVFAAYLFDTGDPAASSAGSDNRADVNVGAFQPFLLYQLGNALYLRSAPIWVYNFENDALSIPLGLDIGKVIPRGKTVFNVFIEP
jgi:hypothetical protein